LSPAGTGEAQWTEVATVPGVEAGTLLGLALADAPEGVLVAVGAPLVCATGVAPPPQEARVTIASRAAAPAVRTR
jgi:hypothetical protein